MNAPMMRNTMMSTKSCSAVSETLPRRTAIGFFWATTSSSRSSLAGSGCAGGIASGVRSLLP